MTPWKGTMRDVMLSPPLTTESRVAQGTRDKPRNAKVTGELEGRGLTDPSRSGSVGTLAPLRALWTENTEDTPGDWSNSPVVSSKEAWLNWRDRKDLTTSGRSDGPSSASKRSQQDDDSGIKAMRLEDPPLASMPRDQMEALTMADRLGGTELDSGSRSTKSSRPDWETVLTHMPSGHNLGRG